jgi:hypothetical protein
LELKEQRSRTLDEGRENSCRPQHVNSGLREILEMTDPKAFLAKSGWYPGIQLE